MSKGRSFDRRRLLTGALTLPVLAAAGSRAAWALDDLAEAARREGPVVWYQTSPLDQITPYLRVFERRFPGVRVNAIRVVSGTDMGARIVQELQAGGSSADLGTGGRESVQELAKRGLILRTDWTALGVPPELVIGGSMLATAASIYVILSNTKLVPEAEAPRNWDDLLDPRWSGGKLALWVSSAAFANLGKAWGEAHAAAYVERLAAQAPLLFRSMYNLAQAVAAGEALAGVGNHLTSQPVFRAGAPVRFALGDPVSLSSLATFAVARTPRPNATKLFCAWMASAEGASAFEESTGVGVHLAYRTRTAQMIEGRAVSEYGANEQDQLVALRHRLNLILRNGGRDAG